MCVCVCVSELLYFIHSYINYLFACLVQYKYAGFVFVGLKLFPLLIQIFRLSSFAFLSTSGT